MTFYSSLLRPALFSLDAERAHHLGMFALERARPIAPMVRWFQTANSRAPKVKLPFGVTSPVGLAAGLSKDGDGLWGLFACGFGFLEIGTVTPRPQPGNDKPRLFRLKSHEAIINRMGFNNLGADALAFRLQNSKRPPVPLGINIGKNKVTPLENAVGDYVECAQKLNGYCDYLAVNVSSPNTPGLRQLQDAKSLEDILSNVVRVAAGKPVFVKIAPDLTENAIAECVDVAISAKLAGIICGNTTLERPVNDPLCSETGGFSGKPLRDISLRAFGHLSKANAGRLCLIGVGGISSSEDVRRFLDLGADAVQLYSAFIYQGPPLIRSILHEWQNVNH